MKYTKNELARNREIEDIFYLFDTNKSGTLEIEEIEDMVRSFLAACLIWCIVEIHEFRVKGTE
jgi:hypothetical protein